MKAKYARILSVIFCVAVIFTVVSLTRVELHGADSATLMFHNDRAWSHNTRLPAELVHSVYYVPISLFVQLPSVDVRMNNTLRTFIITYGDKYLSFDMTTNFAANQDKERMYLKTEEYHGERYVPVEAVCESLGLGYEKFTDPTTSSVAIRITDGGQTQSLENMAKSKYPTYFPEPSDTTSSRDTTNDSTTSEVQNPVLSKRIIYITIDNSPSEYTNSILAVLRTYKCPATFFVLGSRAAERADIISSIAAHGHAIALHSSDKESEVLTDAEAILRDIEAQNTLVERIIKQKSHIRRAPSGDFSAAGEQLLGAGYMLIGADVTVSPELQASLAAEQAIRGIWGNEIAVLRFTDSRNTATTLSEVLKFIAQNREVCELRIISEAFDNN